MKRPPNNAPRMTRFIAAGQEHVVISFALLPDDVMELLSPTEIEIALAVLDGQSNRDIAKRRGTAERTIANQLASIYRKLSIGSRRELIARCTLGDDRADPEELGP